VVPQRFTQNCFWRLLEWFITGPLAEIQATVLALLTALALQILIPVVHQKTIADQTCVALAQLL